MLVQMYLSVSICISHPFPSISMRYDTYHTLLQEMRLNDTQAHFSYLRMSREHFEHLTIVENYWGAIRANITPAERLALTIRYLATGNSQISLSFNFHLGS